MPKQKVPDIDFGFFVISEIKGLFDNNKIKINEEYQRGDIWTSTQQVELLNSIENRYSIGVLVLFINDDDQLEILDGQQRLLTINKYLNGHIDLRNTELQPYNDLGVQDNELKGSASNYFPEYIK
jgi:uncharacterized protein with ParB-like and HNH nuclease domain